MERRILYVASTYSHIVNFHRPYLREFAGRGWKVDVACGGRVMSIPEADRVIHIPFEKSITSPKNAKAAALLMGEILQNQYTLISCHTSLASFFVRLAVLGMRRRPLVACTVHGYLFDQDSSVSRRLLLSGAEKLTAPVTDLLMTMNQWDAEYALKHHLGKRIVNVPGVGVDFRRFHPGGQAAGDELRRELGWDKDRFLLIYGAEFSARKSQATLLHALTELPEQVGLLLPGDGALREDCMKLAHELGLDGRVVFPGQVRDMAPWYAAADGAVSSSRSEGLPFNIMEAMYCGLPIVASNVKGHSDLITHDHNGLLFPYGDSAACASQVRRLLEDPKLRARLGDQARQDTRAYSLDRVLPQIMECYETLLPLGDSAKFSAPV